MEFGVLDFFINGRERSAVCRVSGRLINFLAALQKASALEAPGAAVEGDPLGLLCPDLRFCERSAVFILAPAQWICAWIHRGSSARCDDCGAPGDPRSHRPGSARPDTHARCPRAAGW